MAFEVDNALEKLRACVEPVEGLLCRQEHTLMTSSSRLWTTFMNSVRIQSGSPTSTSWIYNCEHMCQKDQKERRER